MIKSEEPVLLYGGTALCGFTDGQIRKSAKLPPDILIFPGTLTAVLDVALDGEGNVWVVGSGSSDVLRIPARELDWPAGSPRSFASTAPDLTIRSAALRTPGNLAFDADGSLWVANRGSDETGSDGSIVKFEIPVGVSGVQELEPSTEITSTRSTDFFQIGGISFDRGDNLWVTSFAGVLRFDNPKSQTGAVTVEPGAVIDAAGYMNIHFYAVGFDTAGGLWASAGDGFHHLTMLTHFAEPESLTGRSSPPVTAEITGGEDLLPAGGLAFDVAKNLWMATGLSIVMYSDPSALRGTVNPDVEITLDLSGKALPTTNSHLVIPPPFEALD